MPFGEDPNDLPLHGINAEFNVSLMTLLEPQAQRTPSHLHPIVMSSKILRPTFQRPQADRGSLTDPVMVATSTKGSRRPDLRVMFKSNSMSSMGSSAPGGGGGGRGGIGDVLASWGSGWSRS